MAFFSHHFRHQKMAVNASHNNNNDAEGGLSLNSSTTPPPAATAAIAGAGAAGVSAFTIFLIVMATLIGCAVAGVAIFFVQKRARDRRKIHGEYRPQLEEQKHAKDLPYITPPNIEGLI